MEAVLHEGRRAGRSKISPATQMRETLAVSRRHGVPFDMAWAHAYRDVSWPHDTEARRQYKEILEDQREVWRRAYENEGKPNRSLAALYTLLTSYSSAEMKAA